MSRQALVAPAPDRFTIRPRSCPSITGSTAWQHKKLPIKLTCTVRTHSDTSLACTGPTGPAIPALLTRISMVWKRARVWSTIALTSDSSVTSTRTTSVSAPAFSTIRAVSSSSALVRAARANFAPSAAKASAMARPMPRPAPVISATRFSSFMSPLQGRSFVCLKKSFPAPFSSYIN